MYGLNIADWQTPLVILFGPHASGKTFAFRRLCRWLCSQGYTVSPVRSFAPQNVDYREFYDHLNDWLFGDSGNQFFFVDYILVEILDNQGRRICLIMDMPGNDCFDPDMNNHLDLRALFRFNNKKVFVFFTEPNWKDHRDRIRYVERIREVKSFMSPKDKSVVLFNKVDKKRLEISPGNVDMRGVYHFFKNDYQGLLETFSNQSPITRLFRPYNCSLVPFSSGVFIEYDDRGHFIPSNDAYPSNLWKEIKHWL